MAAVIRQLINKSFQRNLSHGTLLANTITNIFKPSFITPAQRLLSTVPTPYEIVDSKEDNLANKEIFNKVQELVKSNQQGRLFAVVHVAGKQFKVTEGDVIILEGHWAPTVGDKISLDKVLLVGGVDFSLIGKPLIQDGLVNVHATVIEKSLSHTKTCFKMKRRKQYKRINFYRIPRTTLRINKVQIVGDINKPPAVTGLDTAIL